MNILLIQLKRIGDLILTTPAIGELRTRFPDANLTLVVSRRSAELLPAIPAIDCKLLVNSPATWINLWRRDFDYCVDFTRNDRSSLLCRVSRAKARIASERRKQRTTFRSRGYNTFVVAPVRQLHTIDYCLKLLEPLGITNACPAISLKIPQEAQLESAQLCERSGTKPRFVVIHPGAARIEKYWEPQRWAEVITHTRKIFQADVILTGGPSELERQHISSIKSSLREPIVDLSGQTNLLILAALISKARLVLTVDSAPMHFAAAARIPQIALFGPTNPFHWRARGPEAVVLQGDSPVPLREFSPDYPPVPMKQISTQAVIDAMDAMLSIPIVKGS